MRFEEVLARADDEALQELLGAPAVRLLNLLDPTLARPSRLRELVTAIRPAHEVLQDPGARRLVLDLLPVEEARQLARQLRMPSVDPYGELRKLAFQRGSGAEQLLFDALAVSPTEGHEEHDQRPATATVGADYSLFAHQRDAALEVETMLALPPHRGVLHMPTGSGKTRTAMHIISRELQRQRQGVVVWLAFSEELCEQAASEFETAWSYLGDRDIDVYRYWGNRSIGIAEVHDGFMVAGLAKTYQTAKRSIDFMVRLADRASLVVIDEAHQAIAETYRFVLEILTERKAETRLLGLTATPGRTWNEPDEDQELADFFSGRKVTLSVKGYSSPIDYLIDEGYLARPTFESLTYGGPSLTPTEVAELAAAIDVPEGLLRRLAEDEQRNLLIINRVERLAQEHRRTIVFAATVEHARLLATVLRARGMSADAVTSKTPLSERARLITHFRGMDPRPAILCNYGVLTTGFDAPRTSAAVIARPTKSLVLYSQMVGRATRGPRAGGNPEATIVTVQDMSLPGFGELREAFSNWEDVW